MAYTVSVLLDNLGLLDPDLPGLPLHGANLTIGAFLRALAADPDVETLELFLTPALMVRTDDLAAAARSVLPPERRGKGILHFLPLHALPDVWGDGRPRVHFVPDPELMGRSRYLRDLYAAGPTAVVSMTHALGHHRMWGSLARLANAPPVAFDSIVCISRAVREAMRKSFDGFLAPPGTSPPCRLDLIHHTVDVEFFQPASAHERVRARQMLDLPKAGRIVLFLGRLTPNDKADLLPLIDAFRRASPDPCDFLLIAGSENAAGYADRLRAAGDAAGLGDRLLIRAGVPPPLRPLYFGAADIFVFPGDCVQESLGTTVQEAMASGLPVIVSDWDGMPDLVRDGETGILVPTWIMPCHDRLEGMSPASTLMADYLLTSQTVWVDAPALEEALRRLLQSSTEREAMGRRGRAVAEGEYAQDAIRRKWHGLWDELLERAARETPEDADNRRAAAPALGLPTPFTRLFHHYASHVIQPQSQNLRLSAMARAVRKKRETLHFYDETLPLLYPDVMDALFAALPDANEGWILAGNLAAYVAAQTGRAENDILFHVALLLKRGVLDLGPLSSKQT